MDDTIAPQTAPSTEPAEQAPTTASEGSEKLLPQSQVNALIAEARREGRESERKKLQTQTPAAAPPVTTQATDPVATIAALQSRLDEMEMRTKYMPLAMRAGWDDEQTEDLFDLYKAQRPQDLASWIQDKARKFGPSRATPTQPTTQQQAASATPPATQPSNPQPLSDKGPPAPNHHSPWKLEFQENPIGMSVAARRAMDAELGADRARSMRLDAARQRADGIRVTRPQG